MRNAARNGVLLAAVVIASLAIAASAGAQNRCLAGKTKCTAKKAAGLLKCWAKAQQKGGAVDQTCLQRVRDKFDGGVDPSRGCFAQLEARNDGPCLTVRDSDAIENRVDQFVNGVISALEATPQPTHTVTPPQLTATPTPTVLATPGPVDNQRCTGNPRTTCTTNADCSGVGGTCEFWLGGTVALSGGGVATCLTNQFDGSISGTYDVDSGASAGTWKLVSRVYVGPLVDRPCPTCDGDATANDGIRGGTCSSGANATLSCDVNGSSLQFGDTSLDCPPLLAGSLIATLSVDLSNTTAADSLTLTSSNPNCRAPGFNTLLCLGGSNDHMSCTDASECPGGVCQVPKCACDTCNDAAAEPCSTNADCPPGGICGGKRCRGGVNDGAPCGSTSECGSGSNCSAPGFATEPNQCDDAVCHPDGGNEGTCSGGPLEQFCGPVQTFRGCTTDGDCPYPGDTCAITKFRECFTDNGIIGNSITATGAASAPVGHQADITLATAHCVGPTASAAVNASTGLPGPERLLLPVHATDDGSVSSCPTTIGFFATPGSQPVLDRGWTGLAHDALFPTDAVVTVAVTGCAGSPPNCGACSYTGPIANP